MIFFFFDFFLRPEVCNDNKHVSGREAEGKPVGGRDSELERDYDSPVGVRVSRQRV